jgi:hypothetical protein
MPAKSIGDFAHFRSKRLNATMLESLSHNVLLTKIGKGVHNNIIMISQICQYYRDCITVIMDKSGFSQSARLAGCASRSRSRSWCERSVVVPEPAPVFDKAQYGTRCGPLEKLRPKRPIFAETAMVTAP